MRPEKTLLLDAIEHGIKHSTALIFATYDKLDPNLASEFRMNLRKVGGSLAVVKKRMLLKAAEKEGFVLDRAALRGHIGVIFSNQDPVQTTKYVFQFCKANEAILDVVGGRFEGAVCSAKDVELISKLPGQEEMRAQLLGLFEAPMSQTLAVMEAVLTSVMFCLEGKSSQDVEKSDV